MHQLLCIYTLPPVMIQHIVVIHTYLSFIHYCMCSHPHTLTQRSDTDCVLGVTVTIERRKARTCCLNGKEYERPISVDICKCNGEDFEWYVVLPNTLSTLVHPLSHIQHTLTPT